MSGHAKGPLMCVDCGIAFEGGLRPPARFCPDCRTNHTGRRPARYGWTPERDAVLRAQYDSTVKGRARALAAEFGWPDWVVKKRAQQLGLSRPWPADRRDWTETELTFLSQWTGRRDSAWIARRLKRSPTSVVLKQKRLHLARRVRDGYTLRDLCACFGVDHHVIERWVHAGWLTVARRPTGRTDKQGDPWTVSEAAVLAFVHARAAAVDLRKVDQVWFADVVLGAPVAAVTQTDATTSRAVAAVRSVVTQMAPGESFSTPEIHARVSLPAHQVRLALRALLETGAIERVWVRRPPAAAERRSA